MINSRHGSSDFEAFFGEEVLRNRVAHPNCCPRDSISAPVEYIRTKEEESADNKHPDRRRHGHPHVEVTGDHLRRGGQVGQCDEPPRH